MLPNKPLKAVMQHSCRKNTQTFFFLVALLPFRQQYAASVPKLQYVSMVGFNKTAWFGPCSHSESKGPCSLYELIQNLNIFTRINTLYRSLFWETLTTFTCYSEREVCQHVFQKKVSVWRVEVHTTASKLTEKLS